MYQFNKHSFHVVFISAVIKGNIKEEDNQLETFIHELIHVFHCVWGLAQSERNIERKTKRFCLKYKVFTRALFNKILASSKCEGRNGVNNPFDRSEGIGIIAKKVESDLWEKYGRS